MKGCLSIVGSDAHIAPLSLASGVMVGNPCEGNITPYERRRRIEVSLCKCFTEARPSPTI